MTNLTIRASSSQSHFFQKMRETLHSTVIKTKSLARSASFQFSIGFIAGIGLHKIYSPITILILRRFHLIEATVIRSIQRNSFISPFSILLNGFHACILAPILEEYLFRQHLQEKIITRCFNRFKKLNISELNAARAARINAIFCTSIIFGLAHFTNALFGLRNPIYYLPQVIATTIMGIFFGFAKQYTGSLAMPIGMHMGNNTLAWAYSASG